MTTQKALRQLEEWVGTAKHWLNFQRYHAANPHVLEAFCKASLRAVRAGRRKIGAHLFVQQLRWDGGVQTRHTDDFKISNCHFPFYARLCALRHEECAELFVLKPLHDASGRLIPDSATLP